MASLHHLALRTHDVDRLLAFYRVWVGLPVVRDARPRSVWLGIEPHTLLMLERASPDDSAIPARTRELIAFAIAVEDRASLRARLTEAGLLEGETEHTLYARDPDGRRIGFSSYPWQRE